MNEEKKTKKARKLLEKLTGEKVTGFLILVNNGDSSSVYGDGTLTDVSAGLAAQMMEVEQVKTIVISAVEIIAAYKSINNTEE